MAQQDMLHAFTHGESNEGPSLFMYPKGQFKDPIWIVKNSPGYIGNLKLDPSDPMNPEKNSLVKDIFNFTSQDHGEHNHNRFVTRAAPKTPLAFGPMCMTQIAMLDGVGNWDPNEVMGWSQPEKNDIHKAKYSFLCSPMAFDPSLVEPGHPHEFNKYFVEAQRFSQLMTRFGAAWIVKDAEITSNVRDQVLSFHKEANIPCPESKIIDKLISGCNTIVKCPKVEDEKTKKLTLREGGDYIALGKAMWFKPTLNDKNKKGGRKRTQGNNNNGSAPKKQAVENGTNAPVPAEKKEEEKKDDNKWIMNNAPIYKIITEKRGGRMVFVEQRMTPDEVRAIKRYDVGIPRFTLKLSPDAKNPSNNTIASFSWVHNLHSVIWLGTGAIGDPYAVKNREIAEVPPEYMEAFNQKLEDAKKTVADMQIEPEDLASPEELQKMAQSSLQEEPVVISAEIDDDE